MSSELETIVLNDRDIALALKRLPGWEREQRWIQKTFEFKSFLEAIAFVNRVAVVSEKLDHHPDFEIHWKQVTLRNWTHKLNALTQADIILAEEIQKVA